MSIKEEVLDLIDRYWKFDNDQTPVSNWHDKQDLLDAMEDVFNNSNNNMECNCCYMTTGDHDKNCPKYK